ETVVQHRSTAGRLYVFASDCGSIARDEHRGVIGVRLLGLARLHAIAKAAKLRIRRYSPSSVWDHRERLAFYSQFIKEGDLCFDVGANVGNITAIFLELGARVVCIEPQEFCLQHLYERWGNREDVIIVGKAVGAGEGYSELFICEDAPTISTISAKWKNEGRFSQYHNWTKRQRVPMTTLDALIQLYGSPTFCKIDVEGFEQSVLQGLTRPIPSISFEFTREFFDDAKKCISHLGSIGPVEFNCSLGESMKLLFPTWITPDELYGMLDSIDDELLWGDIYAKFLQGMS
ncbi:MAG: FkbM family methyltransferase, partial [Anaerolineae bacterium]